MTLRRVLGSMAGALARLVAMAGLAFVVPTWAKETVAFDYAVPGDVAGRLQAVLRRPSDVGNGQALVLIHHAGGFGRGTTTPYAELFTSRGFTTLELRMFDSPADRPPGRKWQQAGPAGSQGCRADPAGTGRRRRRAG